jgi:hypothetical protein
LLTTAQPILLPRERVSTWAPTCHESSPHGWPPTGLSDGPYAGDDEVDTGKKLFAIVVIAEISRHLA